MRLAVPVSASLLLLVLLPWTTPSTLPQRGPSPNSVPPGSSAFPPDVFDSLETDFGDYSWPTEAGHVITSSFAEFRDTHFHAGIDISSGDIAGYRVFASRDGYVARITISPVGYGKMLEIRHPDGYTTVYAHLRGFAPSIDSAAFQEQIRRECYPIDMECPPGEFPVRKGEVIAFTGKTGTHSPHLHFEIRDTRMNPVNPFLCPPLRVHDTIAPTVTKIAVSPAGPASTVDGTHATRVYSVRSAGKNRYRVNAPIVVGGTAAFAVQARDRMPGSRFRNGVYAYTLTLDGKVVFRIHLDRTPFREAHEIGLYYDRQLLAEGRGRFEKLSVDSPNDLPFYETYAIPSGVLCDAAWGEGTHAFVIRCEDFDGNSAEVGGTLILGHAPAFSAERREQEVVIHLFEPFATKRIDCYARRISSGGTTRTWHAPPAATTESVAFPLARDEVARIETEDRWGIRSDPVVVLPDSLPRQENGPVPPLLVDTERESDSGVVTVVIATEGVFTSSPVATVREGGREYAIVTTPRTESKYEGRFRPEVSVAGTRSIVVHAAVNGKQVQAETGIDLYPIPAGAQGTLAIDGGNLIVTYDSLSVLSPVLMSVEKSDGPDGTVYTLGPELTLLRRGFRVAVRDTTRQSHRALFSREGSRWRILGDLAADPFSGKLTRTLGDLAVMSDSIPPVVSRLSIGGLAHRKPVIGFRFSDNLAGVEYEQLKVYIDNHVVIPEIDGERHRASYQAPDPLERGPHTLTIHLMDRMGNLTTVERRFVLR